MPVLPEPSFTREDYANLSRAKSAMTEKAAEGDPAAAVALANLVNAETMREELMLKRLEKDVAPREMQAEFNSWVERQTAAGQKAADEGWVRS